MEVIFENVSADYQLGPIRSPLVLHSVDVTIQSGSYTAVVGYTGAGKSSLLKAMNGLLLPKEGQISIGHLLIKPDKNKKALKSIRKRVGMVFQFPESQLFAETVEKDICFGPINFGVPKTEAKEIAKQVLEQVGLQQDILTKSPFSLSGGQKRRVAIAGILAMQPDILVLDEPGAGLDPNGRKEIMDLIASWHQDRGMTTVLVTHDMEDVVTYADSVIVMEKGQVVLHDDVEKVFSNHEQLEKWHLDVPDARRFQLNFEKQTGILLPKVCLTVDDLADAFIEVGLA
ncbi:energy-coupling factor transporter ATPase [Niallia endozanthoxylica]|uniref:Energy-coupling factor transporter ATP-binding protein EcfA2 n=1 Tax=Niallia endozanthoxylica TaxID=2036016 RepID=A0A5J5H279_9BACI|nr:energy-coupling factor transporter ATPase [Niallia endozanthoxylica]KAA9014615.1 energy-coupling factor transporter ATPase [Niallia endozanthoxylica]